MKYKWTGLFWMIFLTVACPAAASDTDSDLHVSVLKPGATVIVDRVVEDGKLVVSVGDTGQNPLLGLGLQDFTISHLGRQAKITSVMPFSEEFDVPLNIVMVLDNSDSMRERDAVEPLKAAAEELLKTFRPIDRVSLVVFDKKNTVSVGDRRLHVNILQSSDVNEMRQFLGQAYDGKHITYETWLFEAMLAGYDLLRQIPADEQKFMVVFSDGEDRGSSVTYEDVAQSFQGLPPFRAYAIDFMPAKEAMPALKAFATSHNGSIWKAKDEASLVPIFREVASDFNRYYMVSYLFPPEGRLEAAPASLTIEEVKTIDASPMLGHIYFAEGVSAISEQYVLLEDAAQTAGFDEAQFHDTLDKYRQVLNIIGKRMTDHPEAAITLVGCNANTGEEKGAKALSAARAKAVQDYLQTVWNIAPERMSIEARNLPAMPSTSRLEEGRSDNRRVEILTESPEILNLIRSTYYATKIDTSVLALRPVVDSVYGLANWQLSVVNAAGRVAERQGEGAPPEVIVVGLLAQQISELAVGGDLSISMELEDRKGQVLALTAAPVQVDFIQTSQLLAQKQGYSVVEKYALILFDFDSDAIGDRNQFILAEIVARIRELPDATVTIVGHTDNIGKEDYNQKLSERRAKAVYEQLLQVYGEDDTERFSYSGVGAGEPLYDNLSPETRSFNRTVTIALEYLAVE